MAVVVDGRINKNKFRAQAEAYRIRNAIADWLRSQLGNIDVEIVEDAAVEVSRGAYDAEWKAAGTDGGAGPKLTRLAQAARDRFAKKHSLILIHGDFHQEAEKLGEATVDAVITDPPYRISTDRVYRLASQADWNKNFGAWDNQPEGEFLADIRRWAASFFRVMKPGASGFMFVGEPYINIAQALFDAAGFEIKGSFFWCRSNPGTSVTKADFMPAMDHAIQFTKPGARRTFNYPGEPEGFNWFRSPIALPSEHLALLQEEARSTLDMAKRAVDWIEGAIALRYEQRAIAARASAGKDSGTVHFEDGAVSVTADLPKRVDWNQRQLADLVERIRAGGENPGEYVEVTFKVAERAYAAWPERIRTVFEPARTVRTGRQTFKLTLNPEGV